MYVITADQVRSRYTPDAVDDAIRDLTKMLGDGLTLPPDRAAGDEVQLVTSDPITALRAILLLSRSKLWSVGLGVGPVRRAPRCERSREHRPGVLRGAHGR